MQFNIWLYIWLDKYEKHISPMIEKSELWDYTGLYQ